MARNATLNLQLAAQKGLDRDPNDISDAPTLIIGKLFDVALHLFVNLQRDIALLFHARHYIIRYHLVSTRIVKAALRRLEKIPLWFIVRLTLTSKKPPSRAS